LLLFDFAEREINELTNFEYDTLLFNFSVAILCDLDECISGLDAIADFCTQAENEINFMGTLEYKQNKAQ